MEKLNAQEIESNNLLLDIYDNSHKLINKRGVKVVLSRLERFIVYLNSNLPYSSFVYYNSAVDKEFDLILRASFWFSEAPHT